MDAQTIARLMTAGLAQPTGADNTGLYTGVILTWDESSGLNTVQINGVAMSNLRTIQSGIGLIYQPGDTVMVQRKGTQYYIQGKVAAPGAGAGAQIVADQVATLETTTSATFTDLATFGPQVTINIGTSRRALVLVNAMVQVSSSSGFASFVVTGASSIAPDNYRSASVGSNATGTIFSISAGTVLLTAADGLNAGSNTFTMKYRRDVFGAGTGADFATRRITVIPF
jgi:hypothetical protein